MTESLRKAVSRTAPYGALLALWGLGLWQLGKASLWFDEIINTDLVLGHTLSDLLYLLRTQQPYPPLYALLLKAWSALLGIGPYAPGLESPNGLEQLLRFPSVAASLLALGALTSLARQLRLSGAVVLPLLLALHPTTLWYGRDVRLYALLVLLLLLALLGLVARRRCLWVLAGSAAVLTHYFALFPLAGAMLGGAVFQRRRWHLGVLVLPFAPLALWALLAFRVMVGFQSFAPESPPSIQVMLEALGPDLLSSRAFLLPLSRAPGPVCGYSLLAVGVLGLVLLSLRDPARGGIVALSFGVGVLGVFALWQVRPVHHVRYLVWSLPLLTIGIVGAVTTLFERLGTARVALGLLGTLAALGVLWGAGSSWAVLTADRTLWYPDFREVVAFLNTQARESDRGLAMAGHGVQVFTGYRSPILFAAGSGIGERLRPQEATRLLEAVRPEEEGRWWLLLFQDGAVDPGGVLVGTLEANGGYRVEMLYDRELRVFAYTLPDERALRPLGPERSVEALFEGGIRLRGLSIHREERLLAVYLFWELSAPQVGSLAGTVHLVRQVGERPLVQQDKPVLNAYWPLPRLPVGELLPDRYELVLPPDLPAGRYRLLAALYDSHTGERWPLIVGSDMVDLGEISLP